MISPSYLTYTWPAILIMVGLYLIMGSGKGTFYGYFMALLSAILYAFSFLALYRLMITQIPGVSYSLGGSH